jgi:hypothetical protein
MGRHAAGDLRFFSLSFWRVSEQVVGVFRRHQPRARERQRYAARVDAYPPAPPLLGEVRRRPGAARGVEHEVAGVGRHEKAALDDFRVGLDNVVLV